MTEASSSSSMMTASDRYYALATEFEKQCALTTTTPSQEISLQKLYAKFTTIQKTYEALAKELVSRTEELQVLDQQHHKVQKVFFKLFAPAPELPDHSFKKVHGLKNGGANCAFNSLLQMITHSEALREALISVPAFDALRKACAQYYGIKPGTVDSRQIRLMLARLFNSPTDTSETTRRFGLGPRFEDASEALNCMLGKVTPTMLEGRFAKTRVIRTYEPTGNSRALSLTIGRSAISQTNSTTSQLEFTPDIHIDPIPAFDPRDRSRRIKLREANFQERFDKVFDSPDGGDTAYFLGADPTLEYEYRETRYRTVFDTMPHQLILTTRRYLGANRANDTPMQMPRVLELPENALANPEDIDRRLVLTSFIVYQPGHYISYVKDGNQWYYINDSRTIAASTAEVDKVLYSCPSGGSYIHFYERGDADAEPAMTPRPIGPSQEEEETAIVTLEKLQKLASSDEISNQILIELLDQLPRDIKYRLYYEIWDKATKGEMRNKPNSGRDLLRGNVRLLLKHNLITPTIQILISKRDSVLPQRELALRLCEAVNGKKDGEALDLFGKLDKKYQTVAYQLIWEANGKQGSSAEEFSQMAITTDPLASLGAAIQPKQKSTLLNVADHILNTILDDEIPTVTSKGKTKSLDKDQYLQFVLKLNELVTNQKEVPSKEVILPLYKQLKPEHQSLVHKLIWMAKKPSKDIPHFGKITFEENPVASFGLKTTYNQTSQTIIKHLIDTIMDGNISEDDDGDTGAGDIDDYLKKLKSETDDEDIVFVSDDESGSTGLSGSSSSSSGSSSSSSSSSGGTNTNYSDWIASVLGAYSDYSDSTYDHKGSDL